MMQPEMSQLVTKAAATVCAFALASANANANARKTMVLESIVATAIERTFTP